jgi:hypothetical protein
VSRVGDKSRLNSVAASTGSACHAGSVQLSPVLAAMGVPERVGMGAVRFSLSRTKRVQGQCRWPDDIGRVPSNPHRRDVSGGTGLADGRIRRGDDRDRDWNEVLLQGYGGSRTSSGVGIIRVGIEKLLAVDLVTGDHALSVSQATAASPAIWSDCQN